MSARGTFPERRLGEFCRTGSGGTPSRKQAERYYGGDIPWVKSGELRAAVVTHTEESITREALDRSSAKLVPAGALLVAMYGATVGQVAVLGIEATTNQAVCHVIPDESAVTPRYLYHALQRQVPNWLRLRVGGAQPNISQQIIRDSKIPLPPLPEQRRIAAILDKADAVRRKRQQTLDLADRFLRSAFLDLFGDPVTNPMGWDRRELAEVVKKGTIVTYGIVQAGDEFPGGVAYIRTGDLVDGEIKLDGLRHTDPAIAAKFERSRVLAGEIVISIRATVGTTARVPKQLSGANLTQGTARISPGKSTEQSFLLHYIRSQGSQAWLQRQVKGATFREITLKRLRQMPVFVPPQDLQHHFAAIVQSVEQQKVYQRAHLAKLNTLFAAVQQCAFRGEL